MMRILLAFALLLGGCCTARLDMDELPADDAVYMELLEAEELPGDEWNVELRFYERTRFDTVIQVIRSGGSVVVECFRLEDGRMPRCHVDQHWSEAVEIRTMEVYPGRVTGAVWDGGFAMLQEGAFGEISNVGASFNEEHQRDFGIHGRVVEADRSLGFIWSIDTSSGKPVVTIPAANEAR